MRAPSVALPLEGLWPGRGPRVVVHDVPATTPPAPGGKTASPVKEEDKEANILDKMGSGEGLPGGRRARPCPYAPSAKRGGGRQGRDEREGALCSLCLALPPAVQAPRRPRGSPLSSITTSITTDGTRIYRVIEANRARTPIMQTASKLLTHSSASRRAGGVDVDVVNSTRAAFSFSLFFADSKSNSVPKQTKCEI